MILAAIGLAYPPWQRQGAPDVFNMSTGYFEQWAQMACS